MLYLTDGEDNFENAVSIVKTKSNYFQNMPEMIIVAIGSGSNRNRNFTFTDSSALKTIKFVKKELIPLIDSTYRTENKRIYIGQLKTTHKNCWRTPITCSIVCLKPLA